jgi:hypothetical protein
MLDPTLELREAYIDKLGTLQILGETIPVYDEFMGATVANIGYAQAYCLVTNQTAQDILIKTGFYNDCSITVDIVTKFPKNKGGKKLSEQIANEVLQLIRTGNTSDYPAMTNFQIVTCQLLTNQGLIEENTANTVFRKILGFTHKIKQINSTT